MSPLRPFLFVLASCLALAAGAASGAPLPQPQGKPILTVSGDIAHTNGDGVARFDRKMLEDLGTVTIRTATPWYDGVVTFEGVLMRVLLAAVGADATQVTATALNDYQITIPAADFEEFDVLLAMKRDGEPMPIRDKGPLFIVYPFDSDPHLRSEQYYSRSVWQVKALDIR